MPLFRKSMIFLRFSSSQIQYALTSERRIKHERQPTVTSNNTRKRSTVCASATVPGGRPRAGEQPGFSSLRLRGTASFGCHPRPR
jgi:hypothetical protein